MFDGGSIRNSQRFSAHSGRDSGRGRAYAGW